MCIARSQEDLPTSAGLDFFKLSELNLNFVPLKVHILIHTWPIVPILPSDIQSILLTVIIELLLLIVAEQCASDGGRHVRRWR